MKRFTIILCEVFFLVSWIMIFNSCANQQPPSGGEDDKTPPKIVKISPVNNTIMFSGNSIRFYFDEYINRRSFEEAFKISPMPKGRPEFDWGAKDVEVIFPGGFDRNKTYSIVITKDFKDINGSNQLTSPINFAFSTGDKIDKGSVSGKIFAAGLDRMLVACYIINSQNQNLLKPDTLKPDYITQPDETGSYTLSNLPNATYRLFAFNDDDRSSLYNKEFEKIAVLPSDITVKDSLKNTGNNFLFNNFDVDIKSKEFFQSLKSDSLNIVFSSIENNAATVPPDSRFYFYFKNTKINKLDIANNLKLVDSSANANVKIAFNWLNDSLLQVFVPENLKQGRTYEFNLKTSSLNFKRIFKTTSENQIGNISGSVTFTETTKILQGNIQIQLIRKNNPLNRYTLSLVTPGTYKFENIPEGEYILFAFIDVNSSGSYDYGKYFPYVPSEPFFVFDKELKAKGMWNTDNVQIVF